MVTRRAIIEQIRKLGVPANVKGYQAITEAIWLLAHDNSYLSAMVSRLYPDTAKAIGDVREGGASRVERSIRHAIEVMYYHGDMDEIKRVLPNASAESGKLPNGQFLASIAEFLKMEAGEYD